MTVDERINAWAAQRLGIPVETIRSVEFVQEDEHWYSEATCDPAVFEALVTTSDGPKIIDLSGENFNELIRGLMLL